MFVFWEKKEFDKVARSVGQEQNGNGHDGPAAREDGAEYELDGGNGEGLVSLAEEAFYYSLWRGLVSVREMLCLNFFRWH